MAPPRPPEANLIIEDDRVVGVLICRCDLAQAVRMAIDALVVDAGWAYDEAWYCVADARLWVGYWFKTPDRDTDHGWFLTEAGRARAGATPGVHFSWRNPE